MKKLTNCALMFYIIVLNLILTVFYYYTIVFSEEQYAIYHLKYPLVLLGIVIPLLIMGLCKKRKLPNSDNNFSKKEKIILYADCSISLLLNLYPVTIFFYYQIQSFIDMVSDGVFFL